MAWSDAQTALDPVRRLGDRQLEKAGVAIPATPMSEDEPIGRKASVEDEAVDGASIEPSAIAEPQNIASIPKVRTP